MHKPAQPARARLGRGCAATDAAVHLRASLALLWGMLWVPGCASMPPTATSTATPAASSAASRHASLGAETDAPPSATVYVARRQWHIDVGFAASELHGPLAEAAERAEAAGQARGDGQARAARDAGAPGQAGAAAHAGAAERPPPARYVFFGFGDRHYLLAKHRDAPVLLSALWPGPGLILVTLLGNSPGQAFGADEVIVLRLTDEQAMSMQRFIAGSLSRGTDGSMPSPIEGPYEGSAYFPAVPRYSALHTCITWAAEALRAGGVHVRARLTLVAGQLWGQLRKLRPSGVSPATPSARDGEHGRPAARQRGQRSLNRREADFRSGKPPSCHCPVEPPRWSWRAAMGCCC